MSLSSLAKFFFMESDDCRLQKNVVFVVGSQDPGNFVLLRRSPQLELRRLAFIAPRKDQVFGLCALAFHLLCAVRGVVRVHIALQLCNIDWRRGSITSIYKNAGRNLKGPVSIHF